MLDLDSGADRSYKDFLVAKRLRKTITIERRPATRTGRQVLQHQLHRRSGVLLDPGQHLCGVLLATRSLRPVSDDLAVGSDDEGFSRDAHVRFSVHRFLLPDAKGLRNLVVFVRKERKVESVLLRELRLAGAVQDRRPKDDDAEVGERLAAVSEATCLL